MLTVAEALERIESAVAPLGSEPVPVASAGGRVLARDVVADGDYPGFETTAMDGYAVRGAPPWHERTGTIAAGAIPAAPLEPGEAARVMTGAPVPAGTEAIVPVEDAEVSPGRVDARAAPAAGAHVRRRGEVFRKGHVVLRAGERLEPGAVLLAATAGADPVDVVRLPRVVVAATGAEIVDAGSAPSPGQVRNGNGPALAAALARRGIPAVSVAAVPDDLDRLSGFFGASLDADLVLTTGGVSAGDYDLTLDAAVRAGFTVLFHRVAVKPGKPIAFGRRGGAFWFGLPGNPVSALTTFAIFVEAALDRFEGIRRERFVVAKLESPLRAKAGRESYRDAVLSVRDGDLLVSALPTRGSHDVRSQAGRNALLVVPAEGGEWKSGDPMRCLPLAGGPFVRS